MSSNDIVREFLIESKENLDRFDLEIVELEKRPRDAGLLASLFRSIHTVKGTCGFLGFTQLEKITHAGESLLSKLRNGEIELNAPLTSLLLDCVDSVRTILSSVERTGGEGAACNEELMGRLDAAAAGTPSAAPARLPELPPSGQQPGEEQESNPKAKLPPPESDTESTLRVDVGHLDRLMTLVSELVLARNQILQVSSACKEAGFNVVVQRLNLITSELQEGVMKTRMQPINVVWNKFPRVVRYLAEALGKRIRVEMEGAGTELDKTIIEAIKDPLTHIVRNCCDHGIERPEVRVMQQKCEEGVLTLRAFHEGGQVNIEVSDDGQGMDPARLRRKAVERALLAADDAERLTDREALNLIFLPGFSTAETVSGISGRGVGMDVVKTNIERIGGAVDVVSAQGQGTTFKLKIPLTLAIIPVLIVSSGNERFLIPQVNLLEVIRIEAEMAGSQIEILHSVPVYRRRNRLLPLVNLNDVLGLRQRPEDAALHIVVIQTEGQQFGLIVEGVQDTQEIVVKPLGQQLKSVGCYAGATIMGDGRVALILDVAGLGRISGVITNSMAGALSVAAPEADAQQTCERLLLVSAGSFKRLGLPLHRVSRLEQIPRDRIEFAGGKEAAQYRGEILHLTWPVRVLETSRMVAEPAVDLLQVVVVRQRDRLQGLVVDRIIDIVDAVIGDITPPTRAGLRGSAIVAQQITDLLDLDRILDPMSLPEVDPGTGERLRSDLLRLGGSPAIERAATREVTV